MLFDDPGKIGSGENGGFQALNLALQFGAKKIILVGYDMSVANGVHWHGRHEGRLNNPDDKKLARFARWLDEAAPSIAPRARVINASAESRLTAYEKMPFAKALRL